MSQAEVARRLRTSRQSVSRWAQAPRRDLWPGYAGRAASLRWRRRIAPSCKALLLVGPEAAGLTGELWTVPCVRQVLATPFNRRFSNGHVWRLLRQLDFSPQWPEGWAREGDIADWKARSGRAFKKACRRRRTLIFLVESGLSQRPHRVRTRVPRGQTPGLTFNFNWEIVSAIAGLM